jgi:hypothetical protein
MWDEILSSGSTMVLHGEMLGKMVKEDKMAEVKTALIQNRSEGILLATLSELKIREDLGVSSGREKRMVWEAARQLRFWRAIMLRRDRAYLFQASQ